MVCPHSQNAKDLEKKLNYFSVEDLSLNMTKNWESDLNNKSFSLPV